MKIKRRLLIMAMAIMLLATSCKMTANHPPLITSLRAEREVVAPSGSCQIECIASDEDGDKLSYEWSASDGKIKGDGSIITWGAPDFGGNYTITVKVLDGNGGIAADSITITVIIENLIVTATHKYLKEYSGGYKIGKKTSCDIECVVSEVSDEVVYEWSCDGGEISGEGRSISWTAPDTAGNFTVTVTVSDAYGNMISKSIVFTVVPCSPCTFG